MKKELLIKGVFIVVLIYALFGLYYCLTLKPNAGDEVFFTSDLEVIQNQGWIEAIKKNISIPYMLLAYPFTVLFKNFIALRIVNILLGILLYVYFYYRNKPSLVFFTYLTFYIGTVKAFFVGTNDALFIVGLVIFFNEIFKLTKGEKWKGSLAFVGLLVSFFTREMIIVYVPVILYGFYVIHRKQGFHLKLFKIPAIVMLFFLVCNVPSLKENTRLSYDFKPASEKYDVTWSQLQYLAQLKVNDGSINDKTHPNFKQTREYLDVHGINSLPRTTFESVIFDPALTIKEFFKDFFDIGLYGFRQLALMMFVPFFFLFINLKHKSINSPQVFAPIILLVSMCTFSLIIISFVELRWFAWVFIMCVVFYDYLEREKMLSLNVIRLNNIFIILLSFYGIYRILPLILE